MSAHRGSMVKGLMVCKSNTFVGINDQNRNWSNWSGDVGFSASEFFEPVAPDGLQHLVHVVARATSEGKALKAIGTGWAFEDIAKSDAWVVSLAKLARRLVNVVPAALTAAWGAKHNDPNGEARLVHVEAGIRLGTLSAMLDGLGLALPTLGGSCGQTLAGAISTSTHGGDWKQPPLPDLVRAIHLVTDGGRELWIERLSAPVTVDSLLAPALTCPETDIIRDDAIFNAALVSFGRFGVIYAFVLEVRKAFRLVEVATRPARAEVIQALRDGVLSGDLYGPLFAALATQAPPAGLTEGTGVIAAQPPYHFDLNFNSLKPDECWARRRWETTVAADLPALPPPSNEVVGEMSGEVYLAMAGAAFQAAAAAAVLIMPFPVNLYYFTRLEALAFDMATHARGKPPIGVAIALALKGLWALNVPGAGSIIGEIASGQLSMRFAQSMNEGRRGPHHLITSGTLAGSDNIDFRTDSIELVFDATGSRYIDFLELILNNAMSFQQSGLISLRASRGSRAELSMHNFGGASAVSIEISSVKDLPHNAAWMSFLQNAAIAHGGRPHWGQFNKLVEAQVLGMYGAKLIDWREALLRVSVESKLFSNNFTRQRGLEPANVIREVVSVHKTASGVVTNLCGPVGAAWSPINVRDAIRQIQSNAVMYFTRAANRVAIVEVVNDASIGGPYLRTTPDDTQSNNLDRLPQCMGTPPPTVDDAGFASQTIPLSIVSGAKKRAKIVMGNTGTSVWEAGQYFLASAPGSQVTIPPIAVTSPASPLHLSVFTFDITGGPSGTKATLACTMMKGGQRFGAETPETTIVFISPDEPAGCEAIRKKIAKIQQKIAVLEELDPGTASGQAQIRVQILRAKEDLAVEQARGIQLNCYLP